MSKKTVLKYYELQNERKFKMSNELTLINEIDVRAVAATLSKVRSLQATLKGLLVENYDFGKIPGCGDKPTLLKP